MKNIFKTLLFLLVLMVIAKLSFGAPRDLQGDIKVVHGQDNRVDVLNLVGTDWEDPSRAVAMQVDNYKIMYVDQMWAWLSGQSLGEEQKLCSDELFAEQIIVGRCSGFLVSKDLLVTAGHCVEDQFDCENMSWVFDYELKSGVDQNYINVPIGNIYKCSEIISQHYVARSTVDLLDFALIRLDRSVADRKPLKIRMEGKIENNTSIAVIGHPDGLPKKFADGAKVIDNENEVYFSANLDTFHVNSGSPVFNIDTKEVEGILVRGEADYVYDVINGCYRVNTILNQCKDQNCQLEEVTRISQVEKLKEMLDSVLFIGYEDI